MNRETCRALVRERPVAVLGAGVSGRAARRLILGLGGEVELFDERAGGSRRDFGPERYRNFGMVIRSPGFAQGHPWVAGPRAAGIPVIGEMDLASAFWDGPIHAITGTNGKTTTARLHAEALERVDPTVTLCGNSGIPLSEKVCARDQHRSGTVVLEISSFQAEDLQVLEVDALVWTNFAEDHLDHHATLGDYFRAKARLVERLRSGGVFLSGATVPEGAVTMGVELAVQPEVVVTETRCPPEGSPLARWPYTEDFALVDALWERLGLERNLLSAVAREFRLSSCRMEPVGSYEGVLYLNDSKATNPHAVIGALRGVSGPVIWLGGGAPKGEDTAAFCAAVADHRIKAAVCFGKMGPFLAGNLRKIGVRADVVETVGEAVTIAARLAGPGDTVLFSPGYASFDAFEDYLERGEAFRQAVLELMPDSPLN